MTSTTQHQRGGAAERAAIEHIIARYPGITAEERHHIFDYFRNHASAIDRAAIRGNRAIRGPYRQLCRDHRIDRLPWINPGAVIGIVSVLAMGALALLLGF